MNENDRSVALPVQPAAGSLDSPEVRNAADVCHRQVRGYIVVILGSLVGVFAVGSFMAWAGVRISSLWTLAGALTAIGAVLLLVVLVPYAAMGFCVWRELTGTAMRFSEVTKGTILWLNLIGEPIVSVGVFFVSLVGMRTEGITSDTSNFFMALSQVIPLVAVAWIIEGLGAPRPERKRIRRINAVILMVEYTMLAVGEAAALAALLGVGDSMRQLRIGAACLLGAGVGLAFRIVRRAVGPIGGEDAGVATIQISSQGTDAPSEAAEG